MKARQESKLSMYQGVQLLCKSNLTIVSSNLAFTESLALFNSKIEEIQFYLGQQIKETTGITNDKQLVKENLCRMASDIAGIIYAFASTQKKMVLMEEVNYSYTKLFRLREDLILPTMQNIYVATEANREAIVDYGIDAEKIEAFEQAILHFKAVLPKIRIIRSEKSIYLDKISEIMAEVDALLSNRLDKLAVLFQKSNPDFYNAYKHIRKIDAPNSTSTQVKGNISTALNGKAIAEATIIFNAKTKTNTQSDKEGNFIIKPIALGVYRVNIEAKGFKPQTIENFRVKLGKVNRLNVVMKEGEE